MSNFVAVVLLVLTARVAALHELCSLKDVDCSNKLQNEDNLRDICKVKYYKSNSDNCTSLDFETKQKNDYSLGIVDISPFVWDYNNEHFRFYVLFNITFSNIQWKRMQFRLEAAKNNNTESCKNHCREIIISDNFSSNYMNPLNYDCYWSEQDRRYENETYTFEYIGENNGNVFYGKYIFIVPTVKALSLPGNEIHKSPFVYIRMVNSSNFDLIINPINSKQINQSYLIQTCIQKPGWCDSKIECSEGVIKSINGKTVYSYKPKKSGYFFFQLRSLHPNCSAETCPIIVSPKIYFDCKTIVFTILWSLLLTCLLLSLIFATWWMIKRCRRKYTPTVLLIYSHMDKVHAPLVNLLRKYMQMELNWIVAWDEEIEMTKHGDPYIWCLDAFMKCDCVLYFSNPKYCENPHIQIAEDSNHVNIHAHLDEIFLKVIKTAKKKKRVTIYNIMLEYCGNGNIPSELENIRRFHILSEWGILLHTILKNNWFDKLIRPVPTLEKSIRGNKILNGFGFFN